MDDSIEISLLMPTRERVSSAIDAMRSIAESASDPSRIEIVIYVDDDDTDSHSLSFSGLNTNLLIGPRGRMGEITNTAYNHARGRFIGLINDDVVFRTDGWDQLIIDKYREIPDGIGLVWGNDLCGGGPAHPFLSRAYCELVGFVCPPDYCREYIDTHLYDQFTILAELGHERRFFLPDLVVELLHMDAGKSEGDATYEKPHRFEDEWAYVAWAEERSRGAASLADFIVAAHGQATT